MIRRLFVVLVLLGAAGCNRWATDYDVPVPAEVSRNWVLSDVVIEVPETLVVSDENSFLPRADIVWHGDLEGDRRAQVATILEDGIREGAAVLDGAQRITLSAVLARFHAVTPRAVSQAPSAVHNIEFVIQAFDTETGTPLTAPAFIQADLEALTGAAAIVATAEGRTQKVRIRRHIAQVIKGWLGAGPDPRNTFVSLGR